MVLTAKIFEVRAEATIGSIAAKLKELRKEESVKTDDTELNLVTDVHDITAGRDHVTGILSRDKVLLIRQRGKIVPIVKTIDAPIDFRRQGDRILLTVLQEKHFSNSVATLLADSLFLNYRAIVEANIPSENMQRLHESNPDSTKLIWFDQVDLPGIDKLALAGPSLKDTSLYEDYLSHGKIWYIVYTTRSNGWIFGLTRNAVVTAFTKIEEREFLEYIFKDIFGLIK